MSRRSSSSATAKYTEGTPVSPSSQRSHALGDDGENEEEPSTAEAEVEDKREADTEAEEGEGETAAAAAPLRRTAELTVSDGDAEEGKMVRLRQRRAQSREQVGAEGEGSDEVRAEGEGEGGSALADLIATEGRGWTGTAALATSARSTKTKWRSGDVDEVEDERRGEQMTDLPSPHLTTSTAHPAIVVVCSCWRMMRLRGRVARSRVAQHPDQSE